MTEWQPIETAHGVLTFKPKTSGEKLGVIGPTHHAEQFGWDGPRLSWLEWSDGRMSDCKIDGRRVSPITLRRHRASRKIATLRT